MGGFPGSLGGKGLAAPATLPAAPGPAASRGLGGGFPPSGMGLVGLPCGPPGGGGLGAFLMGGLSLRGGGMAPGFTGTLREAKGTLCFHANTANQTCS